MGQAAHSESGFSADHQSGLRRPYASPVPGKACGSKGRNGVEAALDRLYGGTKPDRMVRIWEPMRGPTGGGIDSGGAAYSKPTCSRTLNRGGSINGFQSRRDCDPKPGVARNELPQGRSRLSINPTGVAPTRRNPGGVVGIKVTRTWGRPAARSNPGLWDGIPLGFSRGASDARSTTL